MLIHSGYCLLIHRELVPALRVRREISCLSVIIGQAVSHLQPHKPEQASNVSSVVADVLPHSGQFAEVLTFTLAALPVG